MVLRDYLPPAFAGLMVAAFLAAFMSTVGTQLNWGSSYLVNDLYKRFMVRDATERHYVSVSKLVTVLLVLGSGYTATRLTSISQGWQIVLNIGFGTGAVYILRWYWWRINAWSEISAMAVAAVRPRFEWHEVRGKQRRGLCEDGAYHGAGDDDRVDRRNICDGAGIARTLLKFYRRVHPTVYGWRPIAKLVPEMPEVRDVASNAFDWVMGCILVYGALFGIGKLVFGEWSPDWHAGGVGGCGLSDLLGFVAARLVDVLGENRGLRYPQLVFFGGKRFSTSCHCESVNRVRSLRPSWAWARLRSDRAATTRSMAALAFGVSTGSLLKTVSRSCSAF